jgi:hypothetical protein
MSLLDRRRPGFGLALLLCLALLGWWGMRSDDAVRAPVTFETPVSDRTSSAEPSSPATIDPPARPWCGV